MCPLGTLNSDDSIEDLREVWGADTSGPQDCPTGAPLPWPTDVAPEGFAIMKGQAFDTETFTKTANAYPSGILPDMRGMTVKGVKDDEAVLAFESDGVKSHGHPNSSVTSANLGTKYTSTNGNHNHYTRGGYQGGYTNSYHNADAAGGSHGNVLYTNTAGNHSHSVAIGSHAHGVIIAAFGETENTVKNIKFNWIVRLL